MSYRADKLVIDTHTHRPTDAGDDNTRRPKLASGKKSITWGISSIVDFHKLAFEASWGVINAITAVASKLQLKHKP